MKRKSDTKQRPTHKSIRFSLRDNELTYYKMTKNNTNDPMFTTMNAVMKNDVENEPVLSAEVHSDAYLEWLSKKETMVHPVTPRAPKTKKKSGSAPPPKKPNLEKASAIPIVSAPTSVAVWDETISADSKVAPVVRPYSDAYLSAMRQSAKARIMQSKFTSPGRSIQVAVTRAVGANAKHVIAESANNDDLAESLRAALSTIIKARVAADPDFDPKHFQNTQKLISI